MMEFPKNPDVEVREPIRMGPPEEKVVEVKEKVKALEQVTFSIGEVVEIKGEPFEITCISQRRLTLKPKERE